MCVQCYTAGREASYVTTVVLAARCTHLLVCLHKSLYHSDYMANWIVYGKWNRTLELLHLTPGAEPVATSGLQLLHSCSFQCSEEVWKQRKSSGMLFLHQKQPLAHQVQEVLVYALGSMSHVSGTHTSIALFLFLPFVLWYLPLLIKTHAHTRPLMYQPGSNWDWTSCSTVVRTWGEIESQI